MPRDMEAALFTGLPMPACILDSENRLMAMNAAATTIWGSNGVGQSVASVLGLSTMTGNRGVWEELFQSGPMQRVLCQVTGRNGGTWTAAVVRVTLATDPPLVALVVLDPNATRELTDAPAWLLRDPVTGLGSRHLWERERSAWAHRSGSVVFFDLDDLKEVNDLHGHLAGDRVLLAVGQAIRQATPRDGLAVRYGGDEFIVLLPDPDGDTADRWAKTIAMRLASSPLAQNLPVVPRLSHGAASFRAGELLGAIARADDMVYARKGILLQAGSGGRIILTRAGRDAVQRPGSTEGPTEPHPGGVHLQLAAFWEEWYADAVRRFVAAVRPLAGSAVVEVEAGNGMLTFGGGLAEQIGAKGQLLVVDSSETRLLQARQKAEALGCDWVRFLPAPADTLPLASNTVDLVVSAHLFNASGDPVRVLREASRIVHPGGRVVVCWGVQYGWSGQWLEVLEPLCHRLRHHGIAVRTSVPQPHEAREWVAQAYLEEDRTVTIPGPPFLRFASRDVALSFATQSALVRAMLRDLPPSERESAHKEITRKIQDCFAKDAADWTIGDIWLKVLFAHQPG